MTEDKQASNHKRVIKVTAPTKYWIWKIRQWCKSNPTPDK